MQVKRFILVERRATSLWSTKQMREWIKNKQRLRKETDLSLHIAEAAEALVEAGLLTQGKVEPGKKQHGRRVQWFQKVPWAQVHGHGTAEAEMGRLRVPSDAFL